MVPILYDTLFKSEIVKCPTNFWNLRGTLFAIFVIHQLLRIVTRNDVSSYHHTDVAQVVMEKCIIYEDEDDGGFSATYNYEFLDGNDDDIG